jgi:chitin-binding protein
MTQHVDPYDVHPTASLIRQRAAGLLAISTLGFALLHAGSAFAHGYVSSPPARGLLCKQGGNSGCGAVQWEPQSLEGFSGFPAQGPADGRIASAGLTQFAELDEQTSSRWAKTPIAAGLANFSWTFSANHVARQWRYYITRPDWNPNQTLSRASFELTPFCTADGGMQRPPMTVTHSCTVPSRTGYQVILAVWEVGDTAMSFYDVMDVMFKDGATTPPLSWTRKGILYPSTDLTGGDAVRTRVFDAQGERPELETRLDVVNDTEGKAANWAYLLASRINAEQALVRAGQIAANGSINPVYGQNLIYAQNGSGISSVEIQIEKKVAPIPNELSISDLQSSYPMSGGVAQVSFTAAAQGDLDISGSLFDAAGVAKGYVTAQLNNETRALSLSVAQAVAGTYSLVIKAVAKGGGELIQKTYSVSLTAAPAAVGHDYVFPDGLKSYTAGTRVLQPRDGRVYECKPWPYSGYCVQWSQGANQFEPGVGSHWQDAWQVK